MTCINAKLPTNNAKLPINNTQDFLKGESKYLKKGVWGITSEAVWVYILKTLKSLHDFEHMFEELSITKSVANLGEELGGYGPLPP